MNALIQKMPNWIAKPFADRSRWWIFAVFFVLVFFLFTHQRQDSTCTHNITVYNAIELQLNCDTNSINNYAHDPVKLVTEFHNWKGRPVYLAYGLIVGHALMPVAQPVWRLLIKPWVKMKAYFNNFSRNFHIHLGYVLLNILVVFFCARSGLRLSKVPITNVSAIALAAAIASLDLVQGGVFMFHTNLFNMVAAVGAAIYVSMGMSAHFQTSRQVSLLGGLVGMGILTYPSIVILAPAYLVGNVYGRLRWPTTSASWGTLASRYALFALSAAVLPLLWYVLISQVFETQVYLTAKYGQFVWILEAFNNGDLLNSLSIHLGSFLGALMSTLDTEGCLVAGALLGLAAMGGKKFWALLTTPLVFCLFIAALGVLSFNFFQGFYAPRLHISVLILAYILIAHMAYALRLHKTGALLLSAIVAYQLMDAALHTASS